MNSKTKKGTWQKIWHFFWYDDGILSWIANLIIAFILIKFLLYPGLALLLGTSFPIVAVVSESMEHGLSSQVLCGQSFANFKESFDNYWTVCGSWYEEKNISKQEFEDYPLHHGFNKGDVIILWRAKNVEKGDVLVFQGDRPQPIIHRVVKTWMEDNQKFYQTKGDHNRDSIASGLSETKIGQQRVYGKGIIRIPYLGWVKLIFVQIVKPFGIVIER